MTKNTFYNNSEKNWNKNISLPLKTNKQKWKTSSKKANEEVYKNQNKNGSTVKSNSEKAKKTSITKRKKLI